MPVNPGLTLGQPQQGEPITGSHRCRSIQRSLPIIRKSLTVKELLTVGSGHVTNHPGVCTVYLAEDLLTCLAEKMFYFHREVIRGIDLSHIHGVLPPFTQRFVLWDVQLTNGVTDICGLNAGNASAVGIMPSLMTNPSQDYEHLKERRAFLQHTGYRGLLAPSSRVTSPGQHAGPLQ